MGGDGMRGALVALGALALAMGAGALGFTAPARSLERVL